MFECLRTSFKLSFRYHIGIKPASSINKTMQIKTSSKLTNSIFWKSGGFRNELLIVTGNHISAIAHFMQEFCNKTHRVKCHKST